MIYHDIHEFQANLKKHHRLIGFDVGLVRIGCALSDKGKIIASGFEVINLKKQKFTIEHLKAIVEREEVYGIVVGYPLQMDGQKGTSCAMVDEFVNKYLLPLEQPIFLQDERLSTSVVTRALKEMGLNREQQSLQNDKAAASYILQAVLDKLIW